MFDVRNKHVTVAGLGKFGGQIAAIKWLVQQGAMVLVTDKSPAEKLAPSLEQLDGLNVEYRLGEHRAEDFTTPDLIVTTPAIPPHNEYLAAARSAAVPITTEIQLFIERCPARIVGVASGSSTLRRIWPGLAPKARAASTTDGFTPRMPSEVSRTNGGSEKMMVTTTPETLPIPISITTGTR